MHIASGNYNPTTSRTYTDVGLFTADEEIGAEETELFNHLTRCLRQRDIENFWSSRSTYAVK
jgi:polyphosphate kinase